MFPHFLLLEASGTDLTCSKLPKHPAGLYVVSPWNKAKLDKAGIRPDSPWTRQLCSHSLSLFFFPPLPFLSLRLGQGRRQIQDLISDRVYGENQRSRREPKPGRCDFLQSFAPLGLNSALAVIMACWKAVCDFYVCLCCPSGNGEL